ncbi:MAG: hypothetical protein C0506_04980 [Anaerolinea sp.]|nr:hypothetical protein [Anaerolinea sp.]
MQIDVIEFEVTCPAHGPHKIMVPVEFPRPRNCAHCFLPVTSRHELRRLSINHQLPSRVGSEAFIG